MSRLMAALLASSLIAIGPTALAADDTKDFSEKGKAAEARKKGQTDFEKGKSADAPKKGQQEKERRGATPAIPADPGTSPATPATPATPPVK